MSVRRVPHRQRWRTSDHRCPWCNADRRIMLGEKPAGRQPRTTAPKTPPPDDGCFAARMAYLRSAARAAEARASLAGRDSRPEWRSTLRVESRLRDWTLEAEKLRDQEVKVRLNHQASPRRRRPSPPGATEGCEKGTASLAPTLSSASTAASERSSLPEPTAQVEGDIRDDRAQERPATFPSPHLTRPRAPRRSEAELERRGPFSSSQVATWKRSLRR